MPMWMIILPPPSLLRNDFAIGLKKRIAPEFDDGRDFRAHVFIEHDTIMDKAVE